MQSLEVTALALPIADCVIDEFKLRDVPEVRNWKYGLEYRLQTRVISLARQLVHLQKAVVRTLLDLDEVRDLDRRRNLGEVESFAEGSFLFSHVENLAVIPM